MTINNKTVWNRQNKNTLTIFHQNIRGLLNKKDELLNSLTLNSPQIICISEHHLNVEELRSMIFILIRWELNSVGECTNVGCVHFYSE
jgi:hypothetical protein